MIDSEFDFKNATYPNPPNQDHSLHTGWFWRKQKDGTQELKLDGHHASSAGKYLPGCVWFETFFSENVVGNSFVPKGIASKYAKFLQQTAHQTVSNTAAMKLQSSKSSTTKRRNVLEHPRTETAADEIARQVRKKKRPTQFFNKNQQHET